jgi:phosphoglycerol transferase
MVLELPYVPFPESSDVGGTRSYDHVRPYLHTDSARWSFGAMKGRPEDWQADTSGAPPDELVPAVAAAGFDGIYVDRFGYPAFAAGLESELQQVVGRPPLASPDGRFSFFDLRAYRERLDGELTPAQLTALGDATVRPVRTDWGDDFTNRQQEGLDSVRWAEVADASLTLSNPSGETRPSELFVKLARPGGEAAQVTITYPDGGSERVEVPPEGEEVERTLDIRPGESTVRISTDGAFVAGSRGGPGGYVQLVGWRITPSVP